MKGQPGNRCGKGPLPLELLWVGARVAGHTAPVSATCPRPCCRALCLCHHISLPISPLAPLSLALPRTRISLSLPPVSLFDTHTLPAASPALPTTLQATEGWTPPADFRGPGHLLSCPAPTHASINTVPTEVQAVVKLLAGPVAPFLGHTAGKQVRGEGRRVGGGGVRDQGKPCSSSEGFRDTGLR